MKLWYIEAAFLILTAHISFVWGLTHEIRLHHDLFKGKDHSVHPKEGEVTVKIGLTLNQVVDVEETNEHVILNAWIRQEWINPRLAWNASEYNNISKINVQPNLVWTPDLYSYANVEEDRAYNGFLDTLKTNIIVHHDGRNSWLAPIILRIGCTIQVKDFPFDTQNCSVKFGSFTHDVSRLKLIPESSSAEFSKYTEHDEWKLLSMACVQQENMYPSEELPHADVVYQLVIRRKPLFLLLNLIFPNVILSFLTVIVYIIPVSAGERFALVVSLLLAMALFLTSAFNLMPDSSEVIPFFSYFLGLTLLTMFFLAVCLSYTLSIHYANARVIPLPNWMREYVLNRLTPYMGLSPKKKPPDWRQKLLSLEGPVRTDKMQPNGELELLHPGRLWTGSGPERRMSKQYKSEIKSGGSSLDDVFSKAIIQKISERLTLIIWKLEQRDAADWSQWEWQLVAKTLDKLSFWIFSGAFFLILFSCGVRLCTL